MEIVILTGCCKGVRHSPLGSATSSATSHNRSMSKSSCHKPLSHSLSCCDHPGRYRAVTCMLRECEEVLIVQSSRQDHGDPGVYIYLYARKLRSSDAAILRFVCTSLKDVHDNKNHVVPTLIQNETKSRLHTQHLVTRLNQAALKFVILLHAHEIESLVKCYLRPIKVTS